MYSDKWLNMRIKMEFDSICLDMNIGEIKEVGNALTKARIRINKESERKMMLEEELENE